MKPTTALSRNPGQDRQASLISSAAALFAAKGFKGTTTKAIARAAGVSEALVFKYFPTKRALYTAILAEKAPLSELLHAVEEVARKRDDQRVFTLIAGYRIRPGADPTMLRLLLFSALEGHELADMFFGKQHRVFYDYLAGYIRSRIEEGAFREIDPLLAARASKQCISLPTARSKLACNMPSSSRDEPATSPTRALPRPRASPPRIAS